MVIDRAGLATAAAGAPLGHMLTWTTAAPNHARECHVRMHIRWAVIGQKRISFSFSFLFLQLLQDVAWPNQFASHLPVGLGRM